MGAINARKIASVGYVPAAFTKSIFFGQIYLIRILALALQVIPDSLAQFLCGDVFIMDRATGYAGAWQFPGQEGLSQLSIGSIRKYVAALIAFLSIEIVGVDVPKIPLNCAAAAGSDAPARLKLDRSPRLDAVPGSLYILSHAIPSPFRPTQVDRQLLGS